MNFERMSATPRLALLGAFALLLGCQHGGETVVPAPPQQVVTGSRFNLLKPLSFPAGSSELLFQNEQLVAAGKVARTRPYCRLTPRTGAPRTLQPATFTVGAVDYDEKESGSTLAMVGVIRIALAAGTSPPVYTMSCGWPEGAQSAGFVTAQQIYNAIGGQFFSMDVPR